MGFTFGGNRGMFGKCERNRPDKHFIVSAFHGTNVRRGAKAIKTEVVLTRAVGVNSTKLDDPLQSRGIDCWQWNVHIMIILWMIFFLKDCCHKLGNFRDFSRNLEGFSFFANLAFEV